ncbi:MAG: DNA repair protein RadC [Bacteroidales bacterium]|jgi:DNA repair protein RadC|nr:DNA repair protein RadC [Bacteroidales bacterium]
MQEEYKRQTITEWSEDDRPREKMLKNGIDSLSDAELLAILIGSGSQEDTAVDLARKILHSCKGNLRELSNRSVHDLCKFRGIGLAKAIAIIAAMELGRRREQENIVPSTKIVSSKTVYELFHPVIGDLPCEQVWALFLTRKNTIIDKRRISQGGLAFASIDIRLLLKTALELSAAGLVLCHNHPSGTPRPSETDNALTFKIKESANAMDILLMDHIIIGNDDYYSYADKKLLP